MDIDRALGFVGGRNKGVLITIKRDGMPQASNVLYAVLDGALHVSVTDDRAKSKNLARTGRGAIHVTSEDFWSWVVVEGDAQVTPVTTDPDDDVAISLRRVYEAISGAHPDWDEFNRAMIDERRQVASLHVSNAYGQIQG